MQQQVPVTIVTGWDHAFVDHRAKRSRGAPVAGFSSQVAIAPSPAARTNGARLPAVPGGSIARTSPSCGRRSRSERQPAIKRTTSRNLMAAIVHRTALR